MLSVRVAQGSYIWTDRNIVVGSITMLQENERPPAVEEQARTMNVKNEKKSFPKTFIPTALETFFFSVYCCL